jgi:hypothetical protein
MNLQSRIAPLAALLLVAACSSSTPANSASVGDAGDAGDDADLSTPVYLPCEESRSVDPKVCAGQVSWLRFHCPAVPTPGSQTVCATDVTYPCGLPSVEGDAGSDAAPPQDGGDGGSSSAPSKERCRELCAPAAPALRNIEDCKISEPKGDAVTVSCGYPCGA